MGMNNANKTRREELEMLNAEMDADVAQLNIEARRELGKGRAKVAVKVEESKSLFNF